MNDKIISFKIENTALQFRVIKNKLYSNWEMDSSNIVESKIENNKVIWYDLAGIEHQYTEDIQEKIHLDTLKSLFGSDIDYLLYSMGYTNI